jgi:hypothetical protein
MQHVALRSFSRQGSFNLSPSVAYQREVAVKFARKAIFGLWASVVTMALACGSAAAQQPKTNIVIIWGDDIGQSNVSAYSRGMMGYKTPNIDRVASEGIMFTDFYAEQSCTAGRASFITGQSGLRTGMTKVGLPGATLGLQKEDPTIAELLKPLGYALDSLARTTSVIEMSSCRRCMALMSSTATSTT